MNIPTFLHDVSLKPSLLNDRVTDLLRDAIVTGNVAPGSRLVEREVAEHMGVSRAPVRDAFLRLETEGLIESRRDGRYVITLDDEQIAALYSVRHILEGYAVRLAVARITDAEIDTLGTTMSAFRNACCQGDTASFPRWDMRWHAFVWDVAGNPYLTRLLRSVYGPIAMAVYANSAKEGHWGQLLAEHEETFAAIADRDANRAEAAMDAHLNNACARLVGRSNED